MELIGQFALPNANILLALLLVLIILGAVIYRILRNRSYRGRLRKIDQIQAPGASRPNRKTSIWDAFLNEKKGGVELKLKELEAQQKQRLSGQKKPTLLVLMRQADLSWRVFTYILISANMSCIIGAILLFMNLAIPLSVAFGVSLGFILPYYYIKIRRSRRLKKFDREFPNAMDIIVRGLRAGLPMVDCMRIAAKDTQEPVKSEFQKVIDDQALGVQLHESITKMAERIPLVEVNFLAIVVKIQSKTGGSLAESLHNLSHTLRERRKMEGKIKAMSQEAKSSAAIIGSLPVFVSVILYFMNPEYILLLFQERMGIIVLIGSLTWMLIGVLVMKKMIDFEV